MKLFDLDSRLMRFLDKMADIMWLNILTVICCIPIFTIGASLTAMHYVALKLVRNEEGYITKDFFKSFGQNFRQSTVIWLIVLLVAGLLAGDYYIVTKMNVEINMVVKVALCTIAIFAIFTVTMVFPVQAKFSNTIAGTIKNSFIIGAAQFPKTFMMIFMSFFPLALCYLTASMIPVAMLFGLSLPAYMSAILYDKTFKSLETKAEPDDVQDEGEIVEDDERIFKDELDETIASTEKI